MDEELSTSNLDYIGSWVLKKLNDLIVLLPDALNSDFSIAAVGSLAGALGGALAAQKVIERKRDREAFLTEIRNTNAAIMVSFSICNTMLALKKQQVLPLHEKFNAALDAVQDFNTRKELEQLQQGEQFEFEADLKTFAVPSAPLETLKDLVFNKVSAHGRGLAALASLEGALIGLEEVVSRRENLVGQFKRGIEQEALPYLYFGLTMPDGHTDQEYSDVVSAIYRYTDDIVFFSRLICEDLSKYGKALRKKHIAFSKGAPKINEADFSGPDASNLMPPGEEYESWLSGFQDRI